MKSKLFKGLALGSVFCLSLVNLTSCSSSSKAQIELTNNGHGSISIEGLAESGEVELNSPIEVIPQPDENYYLDSLLVNGQSIISTLTFTPTESINYIVNATFLKTVKEGEYSVSLTGDNSVEVGKTLQLQTTVYGPDKTVSYFCSDPDLAKVDANGLVTTKKAGFVTITATAESSDKSNPATDSFSFFIEPHYIARMVDSMKDYDLSKGVSLQGDIKYCYTPSSGEDPEEDRMTIPYAISIINDKEKGVGVDFHLDLGNSTSLISMALRLTGYNTLSTATRLGVSYFNDGYLYLYAKEDTTYCFYKKLSIVNDVLPFITSKAGSLLTSSSSSSTKLITEEQIKYFINGGYKTFSIIPYLTLLNTVAIFDEDATNGISIFTSHLATVQTYINSLKESALQALKDKLGEDSTEYFFASQIVPILFPDSLTDARFTVKLNEDSTFDSFYFAIKDTKVLTVKEVETPITYTYLSFDYSKKDLAENYMTTLEADLKATETEQSKLDAAQVLKEAVKQDLKGSTLIMDKSKITDSTSLDKAYSVYDAINSNCYFKDDLTAYRDYVTSLNDETSENYVANSILKNDASLNDFKPYAGFTVSLNSDTLLNALPDMYNAKAGDTFLLHSFTAVGDSSVTSPLTNDDVTFTFKDSKGKAVSDELATYDSATQTISILSTPTADTTLVLTCASGTYSKVTYRLIVKAA